MTPPLSPAADDARRLLERELAKPEYQAAKPGFFERLAEGFWNWLTSIRFGSVEGAPAVALVVLLVVVLGVVAVLFLVYGVPRLNRRGTLASPLFGDDDRRSSGSLRASAARAAADGDFDTAIVESFRAVARSLSERGELDVFPGTTAHAFAVQAAALFPAHESALVDAARSFDDVRYLDRSGSEEAYRRLEHLDRALEAAPGRLVGASPATAASVPDRASGGTPQ